MIARKVNPTPEIWFWLTIGLVAMAAMFVMVGTSRAELPPEINRTAPNVVYITVSSGGGMSSAGSGCYLGERIVLTCRHLFDGERTDRASVKFPGGDQIGARLVAADRPYDTVLLQLDSAPRDAKGVPVAKANPEPSDALYAAGYSHKELLYFSGKLIDYKSPGGGAAPDWGEMTGAANSGDSGGPVFNSDGHIVGNLWGSSTPQGSGGVTTFNCTGRTHLLLKSWWSKAGGQHAKEVSVFAFLGGRSPLQWGGGGNCGPGGCPPGYSNSGGGLPGGRQRPTQPDQPPGYQDGGGNIAAPDVAPTKPADNGLAAIQKQLDDLSAKLEALPKQPGAKGEKGEPGRDAVVDYDALAEQIVAQLPPLKVQFLKRGPAGEEIIAQQFSVPPGGTLKLPPIGLQLLDAQGAIYDETNEPIGGKLKLQLKPVGK